VSALRKLDPYGRLRFDLSLPHIAQLCSIKLSQYRHVHNVLYAVLIDLYRQWTFVEHGVATAKVWIEELVASLLASFPFSFLGVRKRTVPLDAFGQTVDEALRKAPGCQFHQLHVLDPSNTYAK
jgi:hypothetical protein